MPNTTDDPGTVISTWWALVAIVLARLMNDALAKQLELAHVQIAVLKRQAKEGTRRPQPTLREKRRMGLLARDIGRKVLREMDLIFTPETFMRWYRKLCRAKFDGSRKRRRPGRPRTREEIRSLVIRIAQENQDAGYTRISDIVTALGFSISRSTVANILKEAGIPIAPERGMPWKQFLETAWSTLAACDMFTVDTPRATLYVLFGMRLSTREIVIAGITTNPTAQWIANRTRLLTDPFDGFWRDCTRVIHDRDPAFIAGMDPVLRASDIRPIVLPPRSPNLNACAERFVGSVRREILAHVPILCQNQLQHVLQEYATWHNHERPHQGLDGAYIDRIDPVGDGEIVRTSRLNGLLNHYGRKAA